MNKARNSSPLFTLVAIITIVAALYVAKEILLPLAMAILLSFLLTPVANRLERWGLPRILSVIGVVGMSFALLGGLGWIVTNQFFDLSRELPSHKNNLIAKIQSIKSSSERFDEMTEALEEVGKEISGENEKKAAEPAERSEPATPDKTSAAATTADYGPFSWLPLFQTDEPPRDEGAIEVKVVEMPPSPLTQVKDWLGPFVAPLTAAGM
jgi:predicted PurR-regulated permease PerM